MHWPAEAGFWLARSYRYFPAGTVHVAVVDPGVGTERNIIALDYDKHVFLAPDNGLLMAVIGEETDYRAWRLSDEWLAKQGWPLPSATFHGRDIFAPLAAGIATDAIAPGDIGPATTDLVPSLLEEPDVSESEIRGVVVTIDHFGNLITNIDASLVADMQLPQVQGGRSYTPRAPHLRQCAARRLPGPGQFVRRARNSTRRRQRGGHARAGAWGSR